MRYRVRAGNQGRPIQLVRIMLMGGLGVCAALFYVAQHTQIVQAGYNLRQAEKYLDECVKKNSSLEMKIAKMKSPEYLEQLIAKYELKLVKPASEQIVRVQREKPKNQLSSSHKAEVGTLN